MLRKFLDWQLSLVDKGKRFHKARPLITAADTFCYEASTTTDRPPHIRDAADMKRWMVLVVIALIPCIIMAIWNTGVQKLVYTSDNFEIINQYLRALTSFSGYFEFCFSEGRWLRILGLGAGAYLPIMIISYAVGGFWEALFAIIRRHEMAEGFLVTGMLYALILPPTIPYWMVAIGVSFGVVVGKELFGGTGMNILNPALTCRVFLFFTFPGQMTGEIWVGTNPTVVQKSIRDMNEQAKLTPPDGYTQATPLGMINVSADIKRIHVDAIASNWIGSSVPTYKAVEAEFSKAKDGGTLGSLSNEQMEKFVTEELGLSPDSYEPAYRFAQVRYSQNKNTNWNFFFGNRPGSVGETSILACLLGAAFLIYTGLGSWRTMSGVVLGAFLTALIFQLGSTYLGVDGGAWNPARYAFPAYKHLLIGGLAFGLVFMATDPVSSPGMNRSRWIYGVMIGAITILIRTVNPAYPEGVMLAILFCNVFAPLIDIYVVRGFRRRALRVRA